MIRLVAAFLFTAAGTAAGISLSLRLKEEREICREIGEVFRSSALQIRYRGMDVYELSSELKCKSGLDNLTFLRQLPDRYSCGENFHVLWKNALDNQPRLLDEERRLLSRFGELLGTSDVDGQLASIAVLEEELSGLEAKRNDNYHRKGKLFRCVGVLAGAMTGILVI